MTVGPNNGFAHAKRRRWSMVVVEVQEWDEQRVPSRDAEVAHASDG